MKDLKQKIIAQVDKYNKAVSEVDELRKGLEQSKADVLSLKDHPNNDLLISVAKRQEAAMLRLPQLQDILLQIQKEAKGLEDFMKTDTAGEKAN